MNIKDIKSEEIQAMYDFLAHIEDYGHVFHLEPSLLDAPFLKIMHGIVEIRDMMDESFEM